MRTLIILLFISFNSFGQITLQDILDIEDKRAFQRLMIENNFAEDTSPETAYILTTYKKDKTIDNTLLQFSWRDTDSVGIGGVTGYFSENIMGGNELYDAIYDEVKDKCSFTDMNSENFTGKDVAYYSCPDVNSDPRLVELDNQIKKDYPEVWDNGFRATDLQIGFTKSDMLFIIQYPMSEYNVEETIEITKMMLEIYKQQQQ